MKLSDIPNIITLIRIGLVPAVVIALLQQQFTLALLLFFIGAVSDGLDGFIAKRFHYVSRLGSILDPLADKLLITGAYLALSWLALLPWWLVLTIIGRDVVVVCGALAYHRLIGEFELSPTFISKTNTFLQILLGLAVVLSASLDRDTAWLSADMLALAIIMVAVVVVLSGVDYVWTWGKRAYNINHSQI